MFTVYVLKSDLTGKRYIGFTEKTAQIRLQEHNAGGNKYTKSQRPLSLVHTEVFPTKYDARKRELFLKSGQGRKFLDNILR